jgi:hypothetical protein
MALMDVVLSLLTAAESSAAKSAVVTGTKVVVDVLELMGEVAISNL